MKFFLLFLFIGLINLSYSQQQHQQSPTKVASFSLLQKIDKWVDDLLVEYQSRVNFRAMEDYHRILQNWSKAQSGSVHVPVMYFFSGADLYSAMGLFPQAPAYGLIAEFAPGDVDCFLDANCATLAKKRAVAWYEHVAACTFGFSYTVHMKDFLEKQTGILPAFLLVLKILKEKVVHIETSETGLKIITQTTIVNYESKFIKDESSLQYCMNLEGMPPKPWGFLMKSGGTLHGMVNQTWFANTLLSSGSILIHDETGPSVSAYNSAKDKWSLRPYGHFHGYSGNKEVYKHFRRDLQEIEDLYKSNNVPEIPFCFGYCEEFHSHGMLILAEKQNRLGLKKPN